MRVFEEGLWVVMLSCLALCAGAEHAAAENRGEPRPVRIIGRKSVTVTTPQIRLAEVANISSSRLSDDEVVIALQKIVIDPAPSPGKSESISAARVLERLREEGIDLRQVGYALPRVITVKRASRTLSREEVRAAIESSLLSSGGDVSLRELDYRERLEIAPGPAEIRVSPIENVRPGHRIFDLAVKVEGHPDLRLRVKAILDEWRELPVAARSIAKGNVIGEQDIRMARLNLAAIPPDAVTDARQIVGFESGRPIGDGEVFRSAKLSMPPVIAAGSTVMIIYRSDFMQATAGGTALEAGAEGQKIKVKNDSSKKVVVGTVLEPGLVGVN